MKNNVKPLPFTLALIARAYTQSLLKFELVNTSPVSFPPPSDSQRLFLQPNQPAMAETTPSEINHRVKRTENSLSPLD
jgi:hypothetical protein